MTQQETLCWAVKKIAWGYLLLHLNFTLGTLNVLPDWLGYIFMIQALSSLSQEEPSATLLQPLGVLLAVWSGLLWLAALFGQTLHLYILEVLAAVLSLYFHFQLLTNLAHLAARYGCPEGQRLLTLRTVRTLLITLLALPLPWQQYEWLSLLIIAAHLVVAIWLCSVLFSLRRSLEAFIP